MGERKDSDTRVSQRAADIQLEDVRLAQAINYLEAYGLEVGLLINFGAKSLQIKRLSNQSFKQKNQDNPKIE
jgi:long-subunit fatty acid transport protein